MSERVETWGAPFEARLGVALPDPLEVGAGTCLYLAGGCDPAVERDSLRVAVGGVETAANRMAVTVGGGEGLDWWQLVDVPAGIPEGPTPIRLHASLRGRAVTAELGAVEILSRDRATAPPAASVVTKSGGPLIAICMATYEPEPQSLADQIDSIRAQDWPDWVCVISDDCSSAERVAALQTLIAGDERFIFSRADRRRGFYGNFERALRMAPVEASFIALSDQDDRWHPDKLSSLHAALAGERGAILAYGDMRITGPQGQVVSDTFWLAGRQNGWTDIASMLVTNTVTGAASLFRSELLATALPFPPPAGEPFHDQWLAVCALARGRITYVDRPLYDRVRHPASVTADTANAREVERLLALHAAGGGQAAEPAPAPRPAAAAQRAAGWRHTYVAIYLQRVVFARVLLARLPAMDARRRRALGPLASPEGSLRLLLWLVWRSLRPWFGHRETAARERVLLAAVILSKLRKRPARLAPAASPAQRRDGLTDHTLTPGSRARSVWRR